MIFLWSLDNLQRKKSNCDHLVNRNFLRTVLFVVGNYTDCVSYHVNFQIKSVSKQDK